ncbi:MAG: hypothetical protein HYY93_05040 [Planctomycetes bacterium]|nr:hypothetical protein [Planctomycetota bacterium]
MPEFTDSDACVARFRRLFAALAKDPAGAQVAAKAGLAFRLRIRDPEADLHIDCRQRPPMMSEILPGTKAPPSDIEIAATGDVAHGIFSGTIALGAAYRSKQILVTGSFLRIMGLGPLFQTLQRLYPGVVNGKPGVGAAK